MNEWDDFFDLARAFDPKPQPWNGAWTIELCAGTGWGIFPYARGRADTPEEAILLFRRDLEIAEKVVKLPCFHAIVTPSGMGEFNEARRN